MGPVSATIPIDAPRERVFDFVGDLANRPAFTDHFIDEFRLERLQSSGIGAAARYRIPRRGLWVETVIDELDAPHRILERGRAGRLGRIPTFTAWELIEGPSPDGSEATVTFWMEPSNPLDRLRSRPGWYRRQWREALMRLKGVVEEGETVERVAVAGADLWAS